MRVYRICDTLYAHAPFSGEGGRYSAGRWHSLGTRIAYASLEQGTAMLEVLMNVGRDTSLAAERTLIVATIPEQHVATLPETDWPPDWAADIHSEATRALGDAWVKSCDSLALIVPSSAAAPPPLNVLINPAHPASDEIVIERAEAFDFNARLGPRRV